MKITSLIPVFSIVVLASCGDPEAKNPESASPAEESAEAAVEVTKEEEKTPFVAVNVDAGGAAAMMKENPGLVVLDVRTPEEFAEGHIAGAKNIDFKGSDFEARLGELDRSKPYLVHCRSGARSGQSMASFEKLGFENIIHLNTGFNGWQEAGQPVEK
jgi:rhodanese-related sulfurtransferase